MLIFIHFKEFWAKCFSSFLTETSLFWSTASSVFGPKDSPATMVGALPGANHHDPWNRLHGGPSGFPAGPSWAKGPEKRDERERGKEGERRDIPHIKDEKDRSADPNTGFSFKERLGVGRHGCDSHVTSGV